MVGESSLLYLVTSQWLVYGCFSSGQWDVNRSHGARLVGKLFQRASAAWCPFHICSIPFLLLGSWFSSCLVSRSTKSHALVMEQHKIERPCAPGTSQGIQWLKLCTSTAGDMAQSLVEELKSHMLYSMAKILKKKKRPCVLDGFLTSSLDCLPLDLPREKNKLLFI